MKDGNFWVRALLIGSGICAGAASVAGLAGAPPVVVNVLLAVAVVVMVESCALSVR